MTLNTRVTNAGRWGKHREDVPAPSRCCFAALWPRICPAGELWGSDKHACTSPSGFWAWTVMVRDRDGALGELRPLCTHGPGP